MHSFSFLSFSFLHSRVWTSFFPFFFIFSLCFIFLPFFFWDSSSTVAFFSLLSLPSYAFLSLSSLFVLFFFSFSFPVFLFFSFHLNFTAKSRDFQGSQMAIQKVLLHAKMNPFKIKRLPTTLLVTIKIVYKLPIDVVKKNSLFTFLQVYIDR